MQVMAKFIFNLPDIGEGIAEAEIVAWHIKVGERIEEDQPIADMMTDKATVEMESPVSGIVIAVAGEEGDVIPIGSMLVEIETEAADAGGADGIISETVADEPKPILPKSDVTTPTPGLPTPELSAESISETLPDIERKTSPIPAILAQTPSASNSLKLTASPAVRARAAQLGIQLSDVMTPGNHVRHSDLDAYLSYSQGQGYLTPNSALTRADNLIKVIGMRRRIAENMAASKRHIPHFTYVDEMDVTALESMRSDLNGERGQRPKLTMLPFLITAICKTIPHYPMINSRYDDEAGVITQHGAIHLGMATQTDAGLVVPVIRNAHSQNIWQLAQEIVRLASSVRDGSAKSEELSGSTLTLTSLGPLGGIVTTPVINRPEVAIIGPNKIIERPMYVDGKIEPRKLMNMSISCDHRVVDGWDAANFVQALKKLIETPVLLFAN
jgi:2-oxoisovalerate dehydrogenase E2 component (dihydrolipoyl transacylase)